MGNQFASPILIKNGQVATVLERIPLSGSGEFKYDENWLQELLYAHPHALPISEIDQSYLNLVPICREMNTPAGPVDVLYATPEGKLVILEAKLWRNPEARRKVIGQILDYAKELGSWSYEDLQREVSRAVKATEGQARKLFDIVANKYPDLAEAQFVDSVSRNLKRGEFLLLIVGDGIREGVGAIAEFLEGHGTMHFTFGLVEMAVFTADGESVLVQPRIIAQTMIVKRTVITLEAAGLLATDAGEMEEEEASSALGETQKFYRAFWGELIAQLKFDDPGQPLPNVTPHGFMFLSTPAKSNAWINNYLWRKGKEVAISMTFASTPLGEMLFKKLLDDRETIDKELGIPVDWNGKDGKHWISAKTNFPDLQSIEYRKPIQSWLIENMNLFVNVFRPRIERIMAEI